MTTLTSPRNMLIAGIVLILLNVAAIAPAATGAVEDVVDETFASYTKDTICADADCTEAEEDWASSTAQRDYYAWDVTNLADVMAGEAPITEKVGPFTYDITTTRTINNYDANAGELTYNAVKTFDCAADSAVSCDTEVTQLNILFQAQVIGATGMAMGGIMDLTKVGFAVQMVLQDMNTTQAGTANVGHMCTADIDGDGAPDAIPCHSWASQAQTVVANSDTGAGIMAVNNDSALNNAFNSLAGFTEGSLDAAMTGTSHPADPNFNISLMTPLGSVAFMGLGAPEMMISDVFADPSNSTVFARANTYGYLAMADATTPDFYTTFVRDWVMYATVGASFQAYGGGSDANLTNNDDLTSRLHNLLGVDMTGVNAVGLMTAGHLTDTPTGVVATNAEGTAFGMPEFLGMEASAAMTAYNMTATQYGAVAGWVAGWATSASSAQLGLLGGVGTMNAEQFVNQTFGGMSPVGDPYLERSLNLGGAWSSVFGNDPIDLTQEQSGNLLYGPIGLTTRTGATLFIYSELAGQTPPINLATMEPGTPMEWNAQTIAAIYGIDTNAATALQALMMGPIYGTTADSFVPGYLMSSFGTTPYLTQSFNNWLIGWHDPVNAFLATGNPMDMSVGWSSLESNATYFGSDSIPNGDGTNYTVCTGEVAGCDKGETLLEDGSDQLSWRNDAMMAATYGLITPESLAGTTGGFLTGTGDKVDVSGYVIADVTRTGDSTLKGIPVYDYEATQSAPGRSIQANLMETYSLLDATPGALPVYFSTEITMQAEQLSGLIIAGSSTNTFYLDNRAHTDQASTPTMDDLDPVFEIQSSSMIEDDDAETMESSIVQNQDSLTYWTNFDTWIDWVTLLFWVAGIGMVAVGMVGAANTSTEDEMKDVPATAEEEAPAETGE